MSIVSDNFYQAFKMPISCRDATCECGRHHYDFNDQWDWEDGEYEAISNNPESVASDGGVTMMNINDKEYVYGCPCGAAEEFEKMLILNSRNIADYLNRQSEKHAEYAESIKVG